MRKFKHFPFSDRIPILRILAKCTGSSIAYVRQERISLLGHFLLESAHTLKDFCRTDSPVSKAYLRGGILSLSECIR